MQVWQALGVERLSVLALALHTEALASAADAAGVFDLDGAGALFARLACSSSASAAARAAAVACLELTAAAWAEP